MQGSIPEYIDGVPNISGAENLVEQALREGAAKQIYRPEGSIDFGTVKSAVAIALHMHQPLIPAGGSEIRTAKIISNLEDMVNNGQYDAGVFRWCYKRMGEFIPQLLREGKNPRIMLEYSGTLLHGMRQMGLVDVFDALKSITCDPAVRHAVEWLGCSWGHAVAPSTPVQDFRMHVRAWQQYFAALFGFDSLERVRGFSPAEMALPNHPDVAYEFVKTLKDCGYQWVLVQEHSIEQPANGNGLENKHIPHRLVCRNSRGDTASIVAIIKTQGSDTKLVAQMQPYYEARELSRCPLGAMSIPPLVTQIADGENGGVMMNEFPSKFFEVVRACSGSSTPLMNVSEYLEHLAAVGLSEKEFPEIQPIMQKRIWDRFKAGDGPEKLGETIAELSREDNRFHMEGGSWTNNISWVRGYDSLIGPMEKASSLFHEKVIVPGVASSDPAYRNALYHLLMSQTSCYRYWGEGRWTDYGKEIIRRATDVINYDIKAPDHPVGRPENRESLLSREGAHGPSSEEPGKADVSMEQEGSMRSSGGQRPGPKKTAAGRRMSPPSRPATRHTAKS